MATNEALLEALRYVEWREKQGYGVIAIDMARALQVDTQTARSRLKELEENGMLEHVVNRGRYVYRIPGHQVEAFAKDVPLGHMNKYGQPDIPGKITKEMMEAFINKVKPGDKVEYLDRMEMEGAKKVGYITKTEVKKIWPYCIQLTNGHSCTFIEMWWWTKRHQPVGVGETDNYTRRNA